MAGSTSSLSSRANSQTEKNIDAGSSGSKTPQETERATTEPKDEVQEDVEKQADATPIDSSSDPNVVDWDGPDDPEIATNWPLKKKLPNTAAISFVTFLSPLASSMIAPAVPLIMKDFDFTDTTLAGFIVSIYVLGFAVGPLFIAPMSEMYGRLIMYHVCNALFVVFSIACAVAPNLGSLLFFRVMAGIAGSCPLTIGGGSIADLFVQENRGAAMGIFALGPLLGPVIGPVAGGYLVQAEGWRWAFWVLAIAGGVCFIFSVTFQRETYSPILLERKAKKLRKETGNPNFRSKLDTGISAGERFTRAIVRPTKMLIFSPIVLLMSTYMAMVYGYLYIMFTTLTGVFEGIYHFNQGSVGLTFLGLGVGSIVGLAIFGGTTDRLLKYLTKDGEMKPEYRLPPLIPGTLLVPIGLFWFGWSAEKHLHWIMPIIGTGWVGVGLIATFMPIQLYLVDAFTIYAASAIAANTVLRSLMGAFLPLAGPPLYEKLGLGWGNSLLGFIALASTPMSWVFFKYGERIRKSKRFQVNFD